MKRIPWKSLIICIVISSLISNMGNSLQNFEEYDKNPPLGLSNSDSWSKIIKEGGWFYPPYCELVNGSLYIIGRSQWWDFNNPYFYVSKFNTSGIKEWELSIKLAGGHFSSYIFDSDSNLIVLNGNYNLSNTSLIKLNSSGALLFSKEFSLDQRTYGVSLVLGENNSLLIVGNYWIDDPERLFIMKFNKAGQFLWNTSFYIDRYYTTPYVVMDSGYNMYLYFKNNSIYNLAKINSSGAIVWQLGLVNEIRQLAVDFNDNLFIMGNKNSSTGYILKLNSTGNQINEILIENFNAYDANIWHLNDLLVYNRYFILCYDFNLVLKWRFSLYDYITPPYYFLRNFLSKDSHDNVYIIQDNELGNIILIKISSTGEFLSKITWGGIFNEEPRSLILDLDNNIYFICNCEHYNVWGDWFRYTVLVKNPVNGGAPPEPRMDLDIRDYFLFSAVGIAFVISPIALFSILKKNKKRIG